MSSPIPIPARVDDQPHLMIWSLDEMLPMVIGLMIGIVIDQKILFVLLGYAMTKAYVKFRDNTPDGFILHWIYSKGFWPSKARTMFNPFVKRFFP